MSENTAGKVNTKARATKRSYWSEDGQVFFLDGEAWAIELVETGPVDGRRCWEALPLYLGKEEDIAPILKGQAEIPEDMHPRRRVLLEEILKESKNGGTKDTSGKPSLQRRRNVRTARRFQNHPRYLKARERLSFHKTHAKGQGVHGKPSPGMAETAA